MNMPAFEIHGRVWKLGSLLLFIHLTARSLPKADETLSCEIAGINPDFIPDYSNVARFVHQDFWRPMHLMANGDIALGVRLADGNCAVRWIPYTIWIRR